MSEEQFRLPQGQWISEGQFKVTMVLWWEASESEAELTEAQRQYLTASMASAAIRDTLVHQALEGLCPALDSAATLEAYMEQGESQVILPGGLEPEWLITEYREASRKGAVERMRKVMTGVQRPRMEQEAYDYVDLLDDLAQHPMEPEIRANILSAMGWIQWACGFTTSAAQNLLLATANQRDHELANRLLEAIDSEHPDPLWIRADKWKGEHVS